jgi:histone deacetylase 6
MPSLHAVARKWYKAGRYSKCIAIFDKMIKSSPKDARAHYLKGRSLHAQHEFQQAIICYNVAILHDPTIESAYKMKGVALCDLGRYSTAIAWYEHTITSFPHFTLANKPIMTLIKKNRMKRLKGGPRTGIVYDSRMTLHEDPDDFSHPECPERLICIMKAIHAQGFNHICENVPSRLATREELILVHSEKLVDALTKYTGELTFPSDNFINKYTPEAALLATGSLIEITEKVVTGELDNGFAVIRPPGHHANATRPSGFCFFNNVAVAARVMQQKYGLERVLIVDWDVHHGNGTQDIFYDDNSVLFFSTHRGEFYPDTGELNETGAGNIVNIPFVNGTYSDGDMLQVFSNVLIPIAMEFQPQLVIVSSGFDAVEEDPLGEVELSPQVFGHLTHMLKSLAGGKIVLALEGGYNLKQIPRCVIECLKVLKGDAPSPLPEAKKYWKSNERHHEMIHQAIQVHSKNWKSLALIAEKN